MSNFIEDFSPYRAKLEEALNGHEKEWSVKGFIDISKHIYTISNDTKVVSKIIELVIFPILMQFAEKNNYRVILAAHQNHYPDISFIDKDENKYAVDIKTTYRKNREKINGFTLGAYTGYFRNRESSKNITFPYEQYEKHFVLGFIYTRDKDFEYLIRAYKDNDEEFLMNEIKASLNGIVDKLPERDTLEITRQLQKFNIEQSTDWVSLKDKIRYFARDENFKEINVSGGYVSLINHFIDRFREQQRYELDDLQEISSVIRNIKVFFQEKWKIASDKPGSGNTKNIGSIRKIDGIIDGKGPFAEFEKGKTYFDDYWKYYMTQAMAERADYAEPPYNDLSSFFDFKNIVPE